MGVKKLLLIMMSLSVFSAHAMEEDKKLHLVFSTGIGFAANSFFESRDHAMAACLGVGLAKELYDEYSYGGFSGGDLAFDMLGCSLGVIASEYTGFKLGVTIMNDARLLTVGFDF